MEEFSICDFLRAICTAAGNLDELMNAVVSSLVPNLGDSCVLDVSDHGPIDIRACVLGTESSGRPKTAIENGHRPLLLSKRARANGRLVSIFSLDSADLESISCNEKHLLALRSLDSMLSCASIPLVAGEKSIGVLHILRRRSRVPYTAHDSQIFDELPRVLGPVLAAVALTETRRGRLTASYEMMSHIAHDLRIPLTSITICAHLLRKSRAADQTTGKLAESMTFSADYMNRMIQDLLTFTRIESGSLQLQRSSVNVSELIDDVLRIFEPDRQRKSIHLKKEVSASHRLHCDRERVTRILSNLLSNAMKYTPDGDDINISVAEEPDDFLFSIADSGPGISEQDLGSLFDPYRQTPRSALGGEGIGLAVAKNLVEIHGGQISAQNRKPHGATFSFRLRK